MSIKIRVAKSEDLPAILQIVNHIILTTTTHYRYEPETAFERQEWFRKKQAAGMPVIVAEKAGEAIGFGTYGLFRDRMGYRFSVEHSVYVHRDHQKVGVGRKILSELIRLAKIQGMHTMIAGVDTQNQGSIEFHRKMGFVQVGHFREIGYKFDQWLDVVFLQLRLK